MSFIVRNLFLLLPLSRSLLFMMTEALPATSMSLDGKQMLIIVVSVICIILTALSAGARIYGRLVVLRKLFVEDGMFD